MSHHIDRSGTADVLWVAGATWTDLRPHLATHGVLTVVTLNGNATIVDTVQERTARIPLAGGHQPRDDVNWKWLIGVTTATTCVLDIDTVPGGYHVTTPARLVLSGAQPHWLQHPAGPATLQAVLDRTPIPLIDHPTRPCGPACRKRREAT